MILINGIDYTKYIVFPIKTQYARDSSLDQGILTLKNVPIKKPFEPMSEIKIFDEIFIIGVDNVVQSNYNNKKYTHTITFIEQTKLLEKEFVDTCTLRNSIIKNYAIGNVIHYDMPDFELQEYINEFPIQIENREIVLNNILGSVNDEIYISPIKKNNNVNIKSFFTATDVGVGGVWISHYGAIKVINPIGEIIFKIDFTQDLSKLGFNSETVTTEDVGNVIFNDIGTYTIQYVIMGISTEAGTQKRYYDGFGISYPIVVTESGEAPKKNTITDAVNRVINLCKCKRKGIKNKYIFDSEQAIKYSNILSPEFSFTKMTLREALKQIGGYIHAEPRLVGNTILFDDLGEREYAKINNNHIVYNASQDIEQYCSNIDSNVDNLVNINDKLNGTIIEPYFDGLKTPRTELGTVTIKQDNCFFETSYPIENIAKVEIGYMPDNVFVGDITEYIYSSTEYQALDDYKGSFPTSKAYALYYKQGEKNIYGLNFEEQDAISQVFKNPAILNIINKKTNSSYSLESMIKLQYRITYYPIVSARVKQNKSNINNNKYESSIAYNASANKVDTDYYGENLKGAVARFGNIEEFYTYITTNINDIPKAGQLYNKDYCISVVTVERYNNYFKFTIGITKDFNRQNEYVGVDNEIRFYEVSEKQVYERYVVYEDYFVIGDNIDIEPINEYDYAERSIIEPSMLYAINYRLLGTQEKSEDISCVKIRTYDDNMNRLSKDLILPTITFSFGNSALFQFTFNNNFGVGTSVKFINVSKGVQIEEQYCDTFGKFRYLDLDGFNNPYSDNNMNYETAVKIGSELPKDTYAHDIMYGSLFSTQEYPIDIDKDNAEKISFAYQIHCVTNRDDIVIGSAAAKLLPVSPNYKNENDETIYKSAELYVMNREIGKFEKEILDITNTAIDFTTNINSNKKEITFENITANSSGKSIVMVDRETKELIFAINREVNNGEIIELPKMMFRHKIYGS